MAKESYYCKVSDTRPANTTAYSALDVVGATAAVIKFNGVGPPGGRVLITSVSLRIDVTGIPAGMTSFRYHFYGATPPSALADNAAWDLPAGDRSAYLGYIDFGSPADVGSTLYVQSDQINKQFQLAAGSSDLWAYRVTSGGFTPAGNSEVYTTEMHTISVA